MEAQNERSRQSGKWLPCQLKNWLSYEPHQGHPALPMETYISLQGAAKSLGRLSCPAWLSGEQEPPFPFRTRVVPFPVTCLFAGWAWSTGGFWPFGAQWPADLHLKHSPSGFTQLVQPPPQPRECEVSSPDISLCFLEPCIRTQTSTSWTIRSAQWM